MFHSHRPLAGKILWDRRSRGGTGKAWGWLRPGRGPGNNLLHTAHLGSVFRTLYRGVETVGLASDEDRRRDMECLTLCPSLEAQCDMELRAWGSGATRVS